MSGSESNAAVSEIASIFKGKSYSHLKILYSKIEKKISDKNEGVDISYWETLLSILQAFMARLRKIQEENLKKTSTKQSVPEIKTDVQIRTLNESSFTIEDTNRKVSKNAMEAYDSGRYSPTLIRYSKVEPGILLLDPNKDSEHLDFMQKRISKQGFSSGQDLLSSEDKAFNKIMKTGMDEAIFSVEHNINGTYTWSHKYRPRKPKYFNRVYTGFVWNKYNQTHYDKYNPPPKTVQGYKFNICYPHLINKAITPEYTLSECEDNKDYAILRFKAGPPYQDIAFKIVNDKWEYSWKKGFRCQFINNTLELYFYFKRQVYRR